MEERSEGGQIDWEGDTGCVEESGYLRDLVPGCFISVCVCAYSVSYVTGQFVILDIFLMNSFPTIGRPRHTRHPRLKPVTPTTISS